jgi:hypothetical protein
MFVWLASMGVILSSNNVFCRSSRVSSVNSGGQNYQSANRRNRLTNKSSSNSARIYEYQQKQPNGNIHIKLHAARLTLPHDPLWSLHSPSRKHGLHFSSYLPSTLRLITDPHRSVGSRCLDASDSSGRIPSSHPSRRGSNVNSRTLTQFGRTT